MAARSGPQLHSLSARREMSFSRWSRHEPALAASTDHWSRLRCKSYQLMQLPTGNYISICRPKESYSFGRHRLGLPPKATIDPSGTLAPGRSSKLGSLSGYLRHSSLIQPALPANFLDHRRRGRVPSACSQRAKHGFKYWQEDRVCTPGKKVAMGMQGTFLGIGVPRL